MSKQTTSKKHSYKKYASFGVLFVLVLTVSLLGEQIAPLASESTEQTATNSATGGSEMPVVDTEPKTVPNMLYIPKLSLQAQFGPELGLQRSGEVEVPQDYNQVGWYKHSPVPGELGPAVVLGHVDSRAGPAVFFSLGQLDAGDEIIVERDDGQGLVFEVTATERYDQNSFPTELVYGDIDHAGLRLVTCSGWYDRETGRYSHNLVVFAQLKGI